MRGDWVSAYPSTLLQYQGVNVQPAPMAIMMSPLLKVVQNGFYGKVKRKRFPRKAKKWAKKNGAKLISVSGKRFWYAREYGPFPLARNIYNG